MMGEIYSTNTKCRSPHGTLNETVSSLQYLEMSEYPAVVAGKLTLSGCFRTSHPNSYGQNPFMKSSMQAAPQKRKKRAYKIYKNFIKLNFVEIVWAPMVVRTKFVPYSRDLEVFVHS